VLAGLAVSGCGRPAGSPAAPAAKSAAAPAAEPQPVVRSFTLAPGPGSPRQLAGGQIDAYEIDLEAGKYLHATFDQQGVDLGVDVFAPGAKKLFRINTPNGAHGPEEVHLLAETAGRYRLEVSTDPGTPAGTYVPSLRALRPPRRRDRSQAGADRAFYEAKGLRDKPDRFSEVSARFQRSVFLFHEAGDRWHEADAFLLLGRLQQQPREALDDLQRAAELFQTLGDRHFEATALDAIGTCYRDLAEFERAAESYQRALELVHQTGEIKEQAAILNNLGNLFQLHGDLGRSLSFFRESLGLWQRQQGAEARTQEANTWAGIGLVYTSTGDWQRAIDAHWRALRIRNLLDNRRLRSISLTQIGGVWLMTEPHRALPFLERARDLQKDLDFPKDQANTLETLGLAFRLLGSYDDAEATYRQALATFTALNDLDSQAVTWTNLGWVAVYRNQPSQALQPFEQGLSLARQARNPAAEARALHGLAEAERERGNLARAQLYAEASLKIVESQRAAIPRRDLQASYLAANNSAYSVLIHTLMDQHRQQPAQGFDLRALDRSEQARARSLLDALRESRRQRADLQAQVDPEWIRRRRELLREIGIQDARQHSPASSQTDRAVAERTISELLDRLSEVDSEIRFRHSEPAAERPSADALRRQLLDPDTILLEYYLASGRGYLWAVSTAGVQSFELPGAEVLEPLLRSAYEELAGGSPPSGSAGRESHLLALSRRLLGPVAGQLRGKRLLIAADGLQQYVPFAALPDPIGGHEPLLAHHEVVAVPSLAVLAELRSRAAQRRPPPEALAILADPVFDASDERLGSAAPFKTSGDSGDAFLPRLVFTRNEAIALALLLPPGRAFQALDFDASRDLVMSGRLSRYRILHFATHAVQRTDQSELSALVFSRFDPQGHPVDGYLRVPDLAELDLPADLVVLSACDTALGRQTPGEELAGLAQAFLTAGAPRVLASLWQVEDQSTAALMNQLYRRLLIDHLPPGRALREAQLAIRAQPQWRSPRYWAGFVLLGDWQ